MSLNSLPRTTGVPIAAGLSAAFFTFVKEGSYIANFGPLTLPVYAAVGVTVGGASAITEFTKNQIVPMITNDPLGALSVQVIQPGITGVATAGVVALMNGGKVSKEQMIGAIIIGAGAQLVGNYAGDTIDGLVNKIMPKATMNLH